MRINYYYRLYEARQNGVRTLRGAALYFKLKQKRLNERRANQRNERFLSEYNWRKFLPLNQEDPNAALYGTNAINTVPRKKAGPMDIIGK